jgi:hypothetical protein
LSGKKISLVLELCGGGLSRNRLTGRERQGHRNLRSYARRSMFGKREKNFQLISTLFCEAKRGFVENCSFEVITLSRVEISQFFTRCSFLKNICRTCANMLVLVLRFLWPGLAKTGKASAATTKSSTIAGRQAKVKGFSR